MEEGISFFKQVFHLKDTDAGQYSPLVLAYIGDAVYEVIVRTIVVNRGNAPVKWLHRRSAALVKAAAQARLIMLIEEDLTPEEHAVYRRGRNAKSATMARNATVGDYRKATGFEALIGFLYLGGQYERMTELVRLGLDRLERQKKETADEI